MSVAIEKGTILVHRVFDIGGEITLARAEQLLSGDAKGPRLKFATDTRKAIIIKESPLKVDLGEETLDLPSGKFPLRIFARIWNYGVLSVTLEIAIPKGCGWNELVKIASELEVSDEVDLLAVSRKDALKKKILPCVTAPAEWDIFEDYITYIIEKAEGLADPKEFIKKVDAAELILAESREHLSEESRAFILDSAIQYSKSDLAIIDWNSALLIEPDGERDVADVIEFSLTHLLEFRYYDDLLERKLDELYDAMDKKRETAAKFFKNFYADIAEDSSMKYMEFSEFLGRVENSLKTVGDPYLAVVFRASALEFHFDDWRKSISRKMETLAQISQILHGEVNTRRSHWLEIIVIVLIAIEVVPFLYILLREGKI
ncbi:MAG: hypothetical protein A2049_11105 [Elusimicrobia bacterium GWA2_62_23]|nr:MAG: hypothetical protein A2049_11105 [Elusimicrobia bacterium GWA2_62_23]OGR68975.1 MAG: hypothetical protein A2179_00295 [Elusimicrobia bacterium GWC2_63_65]